MSPSPLGDGADHADVRLPHAVPAAGGGKASHPDGEQPLDWTGLTALLTLVTVPKARVTLACHAAVDSVQEGRETGLKGHFLAGLVLVREVSMGFFLLGLAEVTEARDSSFPKEFDSTDSCWRTSTL